MIRGVYTAAAGLTTAALRLGVVSNNVANASTPGYKQDRVPDEAGRSLDLLRLAAERGGRPIGELALGPRSGLAELDLTLGPIQETGGPLDLALGGTGFFAVRTEDGQVRYTRDGGFQVDADGTLRSRGGLAVLNQAGQPIQLPPGDVAVGADGSLLVGGEPVDTLMVVEFAPEQPLRKLGGNLFAAEDGALPQPTANVQVYQGFLEMSNVDLTESTVAVMSLVRAYAANQRLLQMQDDTLSRTVNDVGKV